MHKKDLFLVLSLLFLFTPCFGLIIQEGEVLIIDNNVNEDLMIFGAQITINADVYGDLVAFGGMVDVNGDVFGDVISAGGQVEVNGNISDDLFAAGGQVYVNGNISDNLLVGSGVAIIGSDAVIGSDAFIGSGSIVLNGVINGDAGLAGESLVLGNSSQILGNLNYSVSNNVSNLDIVAGNALKIIMKEYKYDYELKDWSYFSIIWKFLFNSLSNILTGAVVLYLFKNFVKKYLDSLKKDNVNKFFIGLVGAVVIPVIGFLLLISMVASSIGGIILTIFGTFVHLSWILFNIYAGIKLITWLKFKINKNKEFWSLVCGVFALNLLGLIPLIGGIVNLIFWFIGFGAFIVLIKSVYDEIIKKKIV